MSSLPQHIPLAPDQVHVWYLSLQPPPWEYRKLEEALSDDERGRASRFRFSRDRRRYTAGRGLLRAILASYLETTTDSLSFDYSAYGKPRLAEPHRGRNLRFNLSRSGDHLLVGATLDREVGVDVERVQPISQLQDIARRFFAPGESARLASLPDDARIRGFFECWTRKEAIIKALGEGLSMPLDSFEVAFGPNVDPGLLSLRGSRRAAKPWSIWSLEPAPNVVAAVAVRGRNLKLRPLRWTEGSDVTEVDRFCGPS